MTELKIPSEKEVQDKLLTYEYIVTNATDGNTNKKAWSDGGYIDYKGKKISLITDEHEVGEHTIQVISAFSFSYEPNALATLNPSSVSRIFPKVMKEPPLLEQMAMKYGLRLDYERWSEGNRVAEHTIGGAFAIVDVCKEIENLSLDSKESIVLRVHKAIFSLDDVVKLYESQKEFIDLCTADG